ncbi:MAG: TldD/PmbA family protein [Erysipelotrichaceae bacterium]|nr:TldD/PmbA family protein [Erysipelotrichaceae bacterium]
MKSEFSKFLDSQEASCKTLVQQLRQKYDYASILANDVTGKSFSVSCRDKHIGDQMYTQRGFVVRVYKEGIYSEYSFNVMEAIPVLVQKIDESFEQQKALLKTLGVEAYPTPLIEEKENEFLVETEVKVPVDKCDPEMIMDKLEATKNKVLALSELVIECMVRFSYCHTSKLFISDKKCLKNSYVYSEGMVGALVSRDGNTQMGHKSYSGLMGLEVLDQIDSEVEECVKEGLELLDAPRIEHPGMYDVVVTEDVAGLIAHEAFGHGVEMDMFVKGRALAQQYINKPVASELTDMYDGAKSCLQTSSYAFDDEGVEGSDTQIIDKGILVSGINDTLSALRLGVKPTGNGKRQSFDHKAYTRMTNTFFGKGTSTLEEMIASIDYGFLLEGAHSGMEDPKNWGIQCMAAKGREIKEGKLTGKVYSPIILTGYVPDLLKSISMVGSEVKTYGTGSCGKGWKEWVKVSDGGPCFKAKARLG